MAAEAAAALPSGFWRQSPQRDHLAKHNFSAVLRVFLAETRRLGYRLTQEEIGAACGLPQNRISEYLAGSRAVTALEPVRGICVGLEVPPELLGFPPPHAIHAAPSQEEDPLDLSRRGFFATVAALSLGPDPGLDIDRLTRLLPTDPGTDQPRQIGTADIEALQRLTDHLRQDAARRGGGTLRAGAEGQLKHVLTLRDATRSDSLRSLLGLAIADFASVTGWMAYDTEDHDAARRLWLIALASARDTDHPLTADITACVYLDLAHQELHVDRPDDALRMVKLASAAAVGHRHPISASTTSYIETNLAWCHASLGEVQPCLRALGRSREKWTDADRGSAVPWAWFAGDTEISAQHGHALHLLTGPAFARSSAVNLPGLACTQFRLGDLDTAVRTGHRAVAAIVELSSVRRAAARLRQLDAVTLAHTDNSDVVELRHRTDHALTAAA